MFMHKLFDFYAVIFYLNFVNGVVLPTQQGILRGEISKSRDGRIFYSFYGIPYAEPPIEKLRFQNPIPAKPWEGIRDGTILPPPCIQCHFLEGVYGQEDCLYLNVYTPKITNETLLPVMVFTYGGIFMYGDALPHRLGSLGFLSTEDEVIPGNYGLKDGVAVLQWVQNYITDFGGDKDKVTLFGGSSGGMAASLTLLSPLAKGLFHRLISQSASPLLIEKSGKARLSAWKLGSMVGCNGNDVKTSAQLLKCLRNIPAEKLASYNKDFFTDGILIPKLPWGPVIENEKIPGAFLVDEPKKLLERSSNIPWINGINSNEGGMMALLAYFRADGAALLNELDTNYKIFFPRIFDYEYNVKDTDQLDFITEKYKRHFFGEKNITQNIHGMAKMFTSLMYLKPLRETVKLYKGPKYIYYYDHKNEESFAKVYAPEAVIDLGVIHGDELISFYNWSSEITPITKGIDLVVSEQMIDLWTNFAANGDPNYEDKRIWDPVESLNMNYLHIKDGMLRMKNALFKEEFEFIDSVLVDAY